MLLNPRLDDKINISVDQRTKTALQILASRDQVSLSDFIRFAIRFYVNAQYKSEYEKIMQEIIDASTSTQKTDPPAFGTNN